MKTVGAVLRIIGIIWFIFAILQLIADMLGVVEGVQGLLGLLGLALAFGAFKLGTWLQHRKASTAPEFVDTSPEADEHLWGRALAEFESESRRPGLWARALSESNGNDSLAKARYLRRRHEELRAVQEEDEKKIRQAAYLASLTEEERAYALIPKGTCPGCDAVIPLDSAQCPGCNALFGADSAWSIKPLEGA